MVGVGWGVVGGGGGVLSVSGVTEQNTSREFIMGGSGRAQELCKSRGARPGLPGPNNPLWFLWT